MNTFMNKWKWYVYIIECNDGLYYTGVTWNVGKDLNSINLEKEVNLLQNMEFLNYAI